MFKKNPDFWAGIFVFIFSLIFFVTSFQYNYMEGAAPGSGFLPRWASGALLLCAVIYTIQSLRTPGNIKIINDKKGLKKILNLFLALLTFSIALKIMGFTIACTLMLFIIFRVELKWYNGLTISVITSVLLFFIFCYGLKLPFPVNSFGF